MCLLQFSCATAQGHVYGSEQGLSSRMFKAASDCISRKTVCLLGYPCTLLTGRISGISGQLVSHVPDPRPRGLDHQDSLAMQLVPRS
jgi:hypothetical protein